MTAGRRLTLVVVAMVVQVAVLVGRAAGAPPVLQVPLGVAYVFVVPGFALVGLLRLPDPLAEAALSITVGVAAGIAVAQGLVWWGRYTGGLALGVLTVVTTAGLGAQVVGLVGAWSPRPFARRP